MQEKVAVIGIIILNRKESASKVNQVLADYASIVVGRIGVPYRKRDIFVISIIVDGTNETIGALTGKLGNIQGVKTKVSVTY